jgi:hypothetical protein
MRAKIFFCDMRVRISILSLSARLKSKRKKIRTAGTRILQNGPWIFSSSHVPCGRVVAADVGRLSYLQVEMWTQQSANPGTLSRQTILG